MPEKNQITEQKENIKSAIRRNTNRGFISSSSCDRICMEMLSVTNTAESLAKQGDSRLAFDFYMMVLLEAVKLISHADTSSGMAGDVIHHCLTEIELLCKSAEETNYKHFFDGILKTAKNKAFKDWSEEGYSLLKSAVHFVQSPKQAQQIYEVFDVLGTAYDGKDYPDKLLITFQVMERIDGKEAAEKYLMANIAVPELRMIAVENAFAVRDYASAEKLCLEGLEKDAWRHFNKPAPWAYFLERLYRETANQEKLTEMIRFILFHRDSSYYQKLKKMYEEQGIWEKERELLLQELSKVYMPHQYAYLLAQEGEAARLLDVVRQYKAYVMDYGKQLAESFPEDTYELYEAYILEEAKGATDRGKYKKVCSIIKSLSKAGARSRALAMTDTLREMYRRRPAMLEELDKLKKFL